MKIDVLQTLANTRERFAPQRATLQRAAAAVHARYRWTTTPLVIAGGVRVALFALAFFAARLIEPSTIEGALTIWNRWDGLWYMNIVDQGYTFSATGQSSVVFYPLYPLLIWLVGQPLSLFDSVHADLAAAMLISWLAYLGAACILYRLVSARFGATTARSTVLLLSVFPFSLFFGAPYTESLFLLLAVGAFYAVDRQQWWLAAACAALASATRAPGLFVSAGVIAAYGLDWWRTSRQFRWDIFSLLLTPLGAVAYYLYCYVMFGDPFAAAHSSEAGWHRGNLRIDGVMEGFNLLIHPETWFGGTDFNLALFGTYSVLTILFLASVWLIWRKLGPAYALFSLASILVPILTCEHMVSEGRYLSIVFPTFIVLADLVSSRPGLRDALVVGCAVFLGALALLFVMTYQVY